MKRMQVLRMNDVIGKLGMSRSSVLIQHPNAMTLHFQNHLNLAYLQLDG